MGCWHTITHLSRSFFPSSFSYMDTKHIIFFYAEYIDTTESVESEKKKIKKIKLNKMYENHAHIESQCWLVPRRESEDSMRKEVAKWANIMFYQIDLHDTLSCVFFFSLYPSMWLLMLLLSSVTCYMPPRCEWPCKLAIPVRQHLMWKTHATFLPLFKWCRIYLHFQWINMMLIEMLRSWHIT